MELLSVAYFGFLGLVAIAHLLLDGPRRIYLLLLASAVFYGAAGSAHLVLLTTLCLLNWTICRFLAADDEGRHRSAAFAGAIALNLVVLVFFKYANAFPLTATSAIGGFAVPLGISYFTFQMISAVTDAYRRDWTPGSLRDFTLFGLFFPQITSGPIPRAGSLFPQLSAARRATGEDIDSGLRLIAYGLFKNLVVANRLSGYVTEIFAPPGQALSSHYSTLPTMIGCIFNLLELYADFSSYVDIARGSARLIGIHLDLNFDHPFRSRSVTELWRRWHMTLSFWLRDYLFMPLVIRIGDTGNTGVAVALLTTFAICGVWHGAKWTFLWFGVSQGIAMVIEILTKRWRARRFKAIPQRSVQAAGWIYTMGFFTLSEVLFRAHDMAGADLIFHRLFPFVPISSFAELFANKGPFDAGLIVLALGVWACVGALFDRRRAISTPAFAGVCALLTLFLGRLGGGSFIYAGF